MTVKKHNVQYKENISFSPVSLILTDQSSNRGYSMCFQSVAGDLWWRRKKGKTNTFESGMLTTKYLGAVSETNSSKSFSKGTVVNSRQFFATAYFRETKGTFSSWSTNGSLDKEKERTKETKAFFSLLFASTNLLFQRLKKPLILAVGCLYLKQPIKTNLSDSLFWPLIGLYNCD